MQKRITRYKSLENEWAAKASQLTRKSLFIAWLRLALFVSAFALPFTFFVAWTLPFWISFSILFATFLLFVFYAHILSQKKQEAQTYLNLYQKEIRIFNGEWTEEPDGNEWIDTSHDFAHDLDLFGKGSLFQFLNRTVTKEGEHQLADKLKSICLYKEKVLLKQEATNELAKKPAFRESFYVLSSIIEQGSKKKKDVDISSQPELGFLSGPLKYLIIAFPIISITIIALALIGVISSSTIVYLFFIGLGIVGMYLKHINRAHLQVSALGGYLYSYSKLIKLFEDSDFSSTDIIELKNRLTKDGKTASEIVQKLGKIIQFFDQRLNMLLGAVLNGFFLWDLIACIILKKWYDKHGDNLPKWIETLNEIEAINSFATFTYNHPDYTWPELSDSIFEAKEIGHPLIPQDNRINNDFSIDTQKRICVVTGANMAGKSTFLRTVGVNLILAGNGCVVAAKSLHYKPLTFITNMRAVDNLLKNESYFFAELSRLQMIMERLKEKGELFFILDEILKGTNSYDKTNGSIALIKQLLKFNGTGIVATHDLELGHLAEDYPGKIFNNCFEVQFKADGLVFDYKLRTGVTQSHNASFLMRKMGLTPEE